MYVRVCVCAQTRVCMLSDFITRTPRLKRPTCYNSTALNSTLHSTCRVIIAPQENERSKVGVPILMAPKMSILLYIFF